jgi:hypothetical protein
MLKGLELKRDMEAILVGTNQAKASGNDSTARTTASVLSWIKTNTSKGAGGSDPAAANGTNTRTDGTQRIFTEANLKTVLQSVWNAGGKPDVIMTGGFNKQVFSTFTGRASPIEDTKAKKITAAVDAYESDFGTLRIAPTLMALGAGVAQGGVGRGLADAATVAAAERSRQFQQLNFLATYKALTDGGVPPQEAQAAISNPSLMRTLAAKYLGPRSPGNASGAPTAPVTASAASADAIPSSAPALPPNVPNSARYSPSRNLWRDPDGNRFDRHGKALP